MHVLPPQQASTLSLLQLLALRIPFTYRIGLFLVSASPQQRWLSFKALRPAVPRADTHSAAGEPEYLR